MPAYHDVPNSCLENNDEGARAFLVIPQSISSDAIDSSESFIKSLNVVEEV